MAAKSKRSGKLNLPEGTSATAHKKYSDRKFSEHDLVSFTPTTKQKQFFEAFNTQIPIIAQFGSAGTGKTACALYCALREVFDGSSPYDRIIIVRSAVQARDIGFLPGSEDEKDAVYESPYRGLCDELVPVAKSGNYEALKAKGMIEFMNTSFLRGQTFHRAIIIVDEIQSMTYHEAATVITRMGDYTKLVFCGDSKQSDLHKRNDKTCFFDLKRVLDHMQNAAIVEYAPEDMVRNGIIREFLEAEIALGM